MAAPAETIRPEAQRKVKILLVDDSPENLVSLEAALYTLGEELVLANSGTEALRHLLEDDFAAILLDVKMPDMDGFETAELIRSRPRSRHTPILFLTGYKSDEHLFRGYDLGAVDFLFKPIVSEVLRSKVAVFVQLSRNAGLLREQAQTLSEQAMVLQKAEQKFRSLLEAAPDAMVMCRQSGEVVLVNSRTESLFGYSRSDLLGNDIHLLVPDWEYQIRLVPDEDISKARSSGERELHAVRSDGTGFPVEISFSPLQTEEGILITSAIRDITDRRRAEEQIRELNTYLENRVLERTEELLRSNDELAQFAYAASHDLQEPLRTISIYTELLVKRYRGRFEGDADLFIEHITTNARRMGLLIRDLLDFSRVDSRGSDHFTLTSCDAALDEALANLRIPIQESNAVISRDPLPAISGDPVQLIRVFQNLISNAIKYRGRELPRIELRAEPRDHEWLFAVQDNGIGIEPDYTEKIFGIFKRLHAQGEHPGNGMGLAICRKIINRHGGRIWVESEPGRGSKFCFTLPKNN
jgi:PAS domain S-box-containing protein